MMGNPSTARRVFDALLPARKRLIARDQITVDAQVVLAEVAAPTGHEEARALRVRTALRSLGLVAEMDAVGNIVASRPGVHDLAPVVVCAHLDTVFDAGIPHKVARTRERIVGPGIGDNARGLAAMLAMVDAMGTTTVRTRRPILFVATTGEEGSGNLRGARHLFATAAAGAYAAIALDGAGDERVVTHALGTRRYRITFNGPGGHSWASYGAPNAVHAAAALTATIAAWPLTTTPRTTLSVSRIGGGSAINAIPSDAWLEIDLRSTSADELGRLDEAIRHAARRAQEHEGLKSAAGAPLLRVVVQSIGDRPGGALPGDAVLGQVAFDATRLIGRTPDGAIASTDANVPIGLGIPAIAIGAGGRGGETHTTREWFENRDGALGIVRAMVIVTATAELA